MSDIPWPFRQPTPEEAEAEKKNAMQRRVARDRTLTAILPHVKEAQRALREAGGLGAAQHDFVKAQKHLAIFVELLETELLRTPE